MAHVRRTLCDMSTATNERIPRLTLGWRLQMSMTHAGMGRGDMAALLGVSAATISRWSHDIGSPPKRAYLAQWALKTDVDIDWLETGRSPFETDGGPGGSLPDAGPSDPGSVNVQYADRLSLVA